ncbi:hypothetical protein PINS_up011182 [Pythium insidiosum]|nr:hypothetical protein PINS_up011182 [Pythium insidiosum]
MGFAVTVAQVYERSCREYEAVFGSVLLSYDRRGRVIESLFQLAKGEAPDLDSRLPRALGAVFPDLKTELSRGISGDDALRGLISALEAAEASDGSSAGVSPRLFGLDQLPSSPEVRRLLEDRSARLPVDLATCPLFDHPDKSTVLEGLLRGNWKKLRKGSVDKKAKKVAKAEAVGSEVPLAAAVSATARGAPLSSAASGASPDADPCAMDVDSSGQVESGEVDNFPGGSDDEYVVSSGDDRGGGDQDDAEDEVSDAEAGAADGDDDDQVASDEEIVLAPVASKKKAISDGEDDDSDVVEVLPSKTRARPSTSHLLKSKTRTTKMSKKGFLEARESFSRFLERVVAKRQKLPIPKDALWPVGPAIGDERTRMVTHTREFPWFLGFFEGERNTPTVQEYAMLTNEADARQVTICEVEDFYATEPWRVLYPPPEPRSFNKRDRRFEVLYNNTRLLYKRHGQVFWERTHYIMPVDAQLANPKTGKLEEYSREAFLDERRRRNGTLTPHWVAHLELISDLIGSGVSPDIFLDPFFYWPPAYGMMTITPDEGTSLETHCRFVDDQQPERLFFRGRDGRDVMLHPAFPLRRLPFDIIVPSRGHLPAVSGAHSSSGGTKARAKAKVPSSASASTPGTRQPTTKFVKPATTPSRPSKSQASSRESPHGKSSVAFGAMEVTLTRNRLSVSEGARVAAGQKRDASASVAGSGASRVDKRARPSSDASQPRPSKDGEQE